MKFYILISILCLSLPFCHNKDERDTLDIILHNDNHIKNYFANYKFEEGLKYVNDQQYGSAKKCFLLADSACPNMPVILNALGNSASRIPKDSLLAFQSYEKALSIDSNFIKTYVNYGCLLDNLEEYDSAIIIFRAGLGRRNIHKYDRSIIFFNMSRSYGMLGKTKKGFELLDSAKQGLGSGEIYDQIILFESQMRRSRPDRP